MTRGRSRRAHDCACQTDTPPMAVFPSVAPYGRFAGRSARLSSALRFPVLSFFMDARVLLLAVLAMGACSQATVPAHKTTAVFDLHADSTNQEAFGFYATPYPSDLRLTKDGTPDVRGLPNNLMAPIAEGLKTAAM